MSNFEMTGKSGSDFEYPNIGLTPAVCINVIDGGYEKVIYMGQDKGYQRKIFILWEIDQRITKGDFAGQHMIISKEYTFAVSPKSNLRKDLESWRRKVFEEKHNSNGTVTLIGEKKNKETGKIEKVAFSIDMLIGASCILNLQNVSKTKTFISPTSILPFDKKFQKVNREIESNYIPDWIAKKIAERPTNNPDELEAPNNSEDKSFDDDEEVPF
ncbi:hypothetical protein OFS07_10640 [Brachyspira hyodysenteriae]|uniref:phage replication initiation protein, NGO0469 family n=1 Tax=Brachyspira hyodysenteriae TaxID=159 RepID=UPI00069A169C|nr:hypothetical protein [Brachyspira hyodysenteriae]MDA0063079.1 hypothetical protein [Brachyspira hyodysenteriae]MDA0066629.1 hypothetical protein [Brachyspira hyodysenteriae]MDA0066721.1 hypothetical protein [Brachyspira hyodysenteriae]MDA0071718.1 hypothetical protein [Brachyspira hyodysenteriae]MDA0071801.1 hypothetical protein [Brachyspira hyodysenteriae]